MVLIGCKTDLRKDKEQLRKLRAAQLEPITYMQVRQGPSPSPPLPLPHHQEPRSLNTAVAKNTPRPLASAGGLP